MIEKIQGVNPLGGDWPKQDMGILGKPVRVQFLANPDGPWVQGVVVRSDLSPPNQTIIKLINDLYVRGVECFWTLLTDAK